MGGKEVEWTLGFVLAEVDIPVSSSFENHSAPDPASLTSTLPILNPNHHPQEADDGLKDLKTAVRRLALANEFIAQMESTAQEVVVRCRSWQEQYTLLVKQFIGW